MYSSTVTCTAVPNVHAINYHLHNTIQYYLAFYVSLSNSGSYKELNPRPQHQLDKFIKLLYTRVYFPYSYSTLVCSKHTY